ncbi:MAG: DUF2779 domain-containing protein [Elusimicrobiales bacterium]|nr:DUF2779 domain-containing protein [Elusimicrobiales bacterium]
MFTKRISKSQFMMGLQCLKRLWLYNHRRDLRPPIGPEQQQLFDQGHAIGLLAREYFAGGVLVDADYKHIPQALKQTAELIEGGADIVYEGAFVFANVLVRCDILKRNRDGSWDLIEAKGSTEVKDEHLRDVAVQRYVLEGSGLKLKKTLLMRIDNSFIKSGPLDARKLFALEDISKETAALMPETGRDLERFTETLASAEAPEPGIGRHCSTPYDCEFRGYCWKGIPEYSIYDIPRLSWEKKSMLKAMGILLFRNVPDSFDLSEGQKLALKVEKSGEALLDRKKLAKFLKKIKYPLYHIDFETVMPGLPLYDGTRPYQQLPFQVSLHVQAAPGAAPAHFEYLGDGLNDPRPGLISFMLEKIGPEGTLLAFNSSFEMKRIEELERDFPASGAALAALLGRFEDLMKPFLERAYVHPDCHGRFSLKKILPALIPDMTYEGLAVANGGDAQLAYYNILSGKLPRAEAEQLRKDLKIYCGQDTLAMVKIMEHLIWIIL